MKSATGAQKRKAREETRHHAQRNSKRLPGRLGEIPLLTQAQGRFLCETWPDDLPDEPVEIEVLARLMDVPSSRVRRWILRGLIGKHDGLSSDKTRVNLRRFLARFPKDVSFECPVSGGRERVSLPFDEVRRWFHDHMITTYYVGGRELRGTCACCDLNAAEEAAG